MQTMTLLLSLALAATLGVLVYFSVTSLPYLASSPASDPTFGEINTCLMHGVPSGRVGFAVSFDAHSAATWSHSTVARCSGAVLQTWPIAGVTHLAFDMAGRLWATVDAADARVLLLEGDAHQVRGDARAVQLAGVEDGVVVLEASGRLLSLKADGAVGGLIELGPLSAPTLSASADGRRVAVTTGGGLYAFESSTLLKVRSEAPCDVEFLWWLRDGHRTLLSCGPRATWAISFDVDTAVQEVAALQGRVRSVLAGPEGPWVQSCDVLPCTAIEP